MGGGLKPENLEEPTETRGEPAQKLHTDRKDYAGIDHPCTVILRGVLGSLIMVYWYLMSHHNAKEKVESAKM